MESTGAAPSAALSASIYDLGIAFCFWKLKELALRYTHYCKAVPADTFAGEWLILMADLARAGTKIP